MCRNSHRIVVGLSVACIIALVPTGALLATTAVAVDMQFVTNQATSVVLATVEAQESRWNEAHTKIYTYIVLSVEDDFKGETKGKRIIVRQLGGSVGKIVCYVPGQPTFRKAERVLAFLRPLKTDKTCFRVVGMAQGKYSIRDDGTAVRDLKGLQLVGPYRDRARRESREQVDTLIKKVGEIVATESHQDRAKREEEAE